MVQTKLPTVIICNETIVSKVEVSIWRYNTQNIIHLCHHVKTVAKLIQSMNKYIIITKTDYTRFTQLVYNKIVCLYLNE